MRGHRFATRMLVCVGSLLCSAIVCGAADAKPSAWVSRGRRLLSAPISLGVDLVRTQRRADRTLGTKMFRRSPKRLTIKQRIAIWRAHRVGWREAGPHGEYSFAHLKEKAGILEAAGIGRQDRELLIREGVVGRKKKPWQPRKPQRHGADRRRKSTGSERNVGSNHGKKGKREEHSRREKGRQR